MSVTPLLEVPEPFFRKEEGRQVWRAFQQGKRPAEVAEEVGIPVGKVTNYLGYWRRKGYDFPRFNTGISDLREVKFVISLPFAAAMQVQGAARRRKISTPELVRNLVSTVASERLIDGVLDDGH